MKGWKIIVSQVIIVNLYRKQKVEDKKVEGMVDEA
jgi:hypothetical protein